MTRVAQWATGTTGRLALRAIIDAPALNLVGVRVYDPGKVNVDAGTLAGRPATGVLATDDNAKLVRTRPDVVLYMGAVEKHPEECFADVANLLLAGIDVIATGSSFIDVNAFDPTRAADIDAACRAGRQLRSSAWVSSQASGERRSRRCCPGCRPGATGSRCANRCLTPATQVGRCSST